MNQSLKLFLFVVLCSVQLAKAQTVTDVTDIANYSYVAFIEHSVGSGNGAIISDTQVLTSASYLSVSAGAQINIYVGDAFHSTTPFKAKNFQKHPSFNPTTRENNLAVINVDGTFKGLPNVKPISVQTSATVIPVNCFLVGWGIYINSGVSNPRRIDYQLVTDQECATKLGAQPPTIQCARALKGTGFFNFIAQPLVCDNRLYGIQAASGFYSFTDAQPIDIFTRLTAASVQEFVSPLIPSPRKNYVSCN